MLDTTTTTTTDGPPGRVEPPDPRPPLDRTVFLVAAGLALVFLAYGSLGTESFSAGAGAALTWITTNLGWLFVLASAGFVVFSAFLAFSRYGNIRLGDDDATPEFSTFSWVSMMFATGMGIGLMFWGVAEPLTHLNTPPLGRAEPGSGAAAALAMEYTFFHWGLHPWAMYAVIGLAIAYFAYRKGTGNLVSAAFGPLLGRHAEGTAGRSIDVLALLATLFGSATSLGLGALQITGGIDHIFGRGGGDKTLAVAVIAFLTLCFVISAVSGVEKGIKWLSNANAVAAAALAFFLLVVGPTVFILMTLTESLGGYLTHLPMMSFTLGAFGGSEWLGGWTIFYWAWWISWTPFVGMFIARISKGRTIREFVTYVIAIPSLVSFVWFAILGGSAFDLQLNQGVDMAARLADGTESALFTTLADYPLASVTTVLAVVLVAIFFITGADSASIVMGMLSQRGVEEPSRWLIVFWGVATGAVAAVLLWAGGLTALQTGVTIVATPFVLVLVGMCVSLWKELKNEPFLSTLPSAVRDHILEHDAEKSAAILSLQAGVVPQDSPDLP
ncbi:BCCT family transporter [Ornithinimicrobium tianjinense]|uniref:Choline transporter n=1 Tax=Ornithinimicrobium tianjinense TaxID=1195761 RepID=A0A917BRA9_9MICO|nr:BCCT family transporter [Ornithinimicrobium tianjinense]GGF55844.1 choline transporter [Ornithinimicrobium tianjinense]